MCVYVCNKHLYNIYINLVSDNLSIYMNNADISSDKRIICRKKINWGKTLNPHEITILQYFKELSATQLSSHFKCNMYMLSITYNLVCFVYI